MSAQATPPSQGATRIPRAVAIVPARLASTRLPRKMLLARTGRPLFEHTVRNVQRCAAIERVVVATDAGEILEAARSAGIEALLTGADHQSGTDRVHEACEELARRGERYEVVVNVQGDEPDVEPADLEGLVRAFADARVSIATLCSPIRDAKELASASVVKVVLDGAGDALYFSRAPIPDRSHARASAGPARPLRHVGVYAFRPEALARFASLPPGALEVEESLEQLRWLEAGGRIRVLEASRLPRGIDTPRDYDEFTARWRAAQAGGVDQAPGSSTENRKDRVRA